MSNSIRSILARNHGRVRLLEAHDRNSSEIILKTTGLNGQGFDGLWIGGLCQTTYFGIPDTELISPLKRATMLAMNGNIKQQNGTRRSGCAAFDADSGGDPEDIPALVAVLGIMGVSMVIIEDKAVEAPGQKVNSLKASSGSQAQADMHQFAETIRKFKAASVGKDVMITARIESFTTRITKQDAEEERASVEDAYRDALTRAEVYCSAGVDAIMIHSKSKQPDEVLSFLTEFRARDPLTPLVVVPTTYSKTMRDTLYDAGANVVIYANHLMRAKINAVGQLSDKILMEKPTLFSDDPELSAYLQARNFGCLLGKLWERKYMGQTTNDAEWYRVVAEASATENMKAVTRELLDGKLSGCEADQRMIPVGDLLQINNRQVAEVW